MSLQLQAVVSLDHSKFGAGLSTLSGLVSNATGAMMMAFGGVTGEIFAMTRAFGPLGAAIGVMKEATTVGASFEQQMANVASVSGLMGDELKKVELATRDLAKTTRFTATEAGDAMYSLASAGVAGADALSNALRPSLLLAGATMSSTKMATEAMTAALANFQIDAKDAMHVADQFAGAIATSPATMERLSEAFKYAGPAAAGFGISLEKTVAEIAAFHQIGLRGEQAGTSFRMALIQLSEEANKSGSVIGAALKGWTAGTEGITGAVRRLNAAGVDTEVVIKELGARAGPGMAAMMKFGADAMDNLAGRITKAADVSKMYELQLGTLSGRFAIFKSAIEETMLTLYGSMAPALTKITEQMTKLADEVTKLIKAMIAGDWATVKKMLTDAFESGIEAAKKFGETLIQRIALPQTFAALRNALDTVSVYFTSAKNTATDLFNRLRNTDWATVLEKSLKLIDSALAAVVKTIDGTIKAVQAMAQAWRDLDAGVKVALLVITGSAGIVVGLVKLIAMIEATAKATIALSVAMKANLISHAETAYIKLLLLGDAIKAVTLAQVGMVAGAAALGVGLGLLIRQIPGVASALDNFTIKVGQFLGLVEKEDEALKASNEELARRRQLNSDSILAQQKLTDSIDENNDALYEQEDAAAQAINEIIKVERAAAAEAEAMQKASNATNGASNSFSKLAIAAEPIGPIIGEFIDEIDKADMADNLKAMGEAMSGTAKQVQELADATKESKVSVTDLFGMLNKFKEMKITAFDVSAFVDAMKRLAVGLADVKLPEIKLPDFSLLKIPRVNAMEVSGFVNAMKQLATGLTGVPFPDMTPLTDLAFITIPTISRGAVVDLLHNLGLLKNGLMDIDFGGLGKIDVNITGKAGDPAAVLSEIRDMLKGAKGIVWA
jgi:TP901 family phage tail tape measure protein